MPNKKVVIGAVGHGIKIRRAIWNIACLVFIRPFPTKLSWWWRWLWLKAFGAKVDFWAHVYSSVTIWAPWNLKMEKGSCLGPHVICYNQAMVTLEEGATVSQYAYLCTAGHKTDERNSASSGLIIAPIVIRREAWVGTRAFVNMGVVIGESAVVGATASVYKDVEDRTIVGGNPAKFIKTRIIKDREY